MKKTIYAPVTSEHPSGTGMDRYVWDVTHYNAVSARALCSDGKIHRVRLNQQADTFFSWPGRVTLAGKTVKVFVSPDNDGTLVAHPDPNR